LAIEPDHVNALSGLSVIDAQQGRLAAVRARVEERVRRSAHPGTDLLMLAAKTCVVTRDPDCAEAYLRRIVEADPANVETYSLLAQFYLARRKSKEARLEFEQIVQRQPKAGGAHTMLGLLYQAEGDLDRAQKSFAVAVNVDSKAAVAANNLAWILSHRDGGDLDSALTYAQMGRALMPESAAAADTLAFVYYKKQMGQFSINLLEQALAAEPENPEFLYHQGLVYAQAHEDSKARRSLEAALKLNPKFRGADDARKIISTLVY
jgi:tetratricopeptide (TPR) repeat protein